MPSPRPNRKRPRATIGAGLALVPLLLLTLAPTVAQPSDAADQQAAGPAAQRTILELTARIARIDAAAADLANSDDAATLRQRWAAIQPDLQSLVTAPRIAPEPLTETHATTFTTLARRYRGQLQALHAEVGARLEAQQALAAASAALPAMRSVLVDTIGPLTENADGSTSPDGSIAIVPAQGAPAQGAAVSLATLHAEGGALLALLEQWAGAPHPGLLDAQQQDATRALRVFQAASAQFRATALARENPVLSKQVGALDEAFSKAVDGTGGLLSLRRAWLELNERTAARAARTRALADLLLQQVLAPFAAAPPKAGADVGPHTGPDTGEAAADSAAAVAQTPSGTQRAAWLPWLIVLGLAAGAVATGLLLLRLGRRERRLLRRAQQQTERANQALAAVAFSARQLLGNDDWELDLATVLARLGEAGGAQRVCVLQRPDSGASAPGGPLHRQWSTSLPPLRQRDILALGSWLGAQAQGEPVLVSPGQQPLPQDRLLQRLGIRTLIAVPITVEQHCWGWLGFCYVTGKQEWPQRLVEAIYAAADMLGAGIARSRAVAQLRQAAAVFESSSEGIIITDAEQQILAVNAAFTRLTGHPADAVLGRTTALLTADGGQQRRQWASVWSALARDGTWQGEITQRRHAGAPLPVWLSASAIRNVRGAVTQYALVFSDISELKASEQRLAHLAHHDALTGLPNRVLLRDRVDGAIARARRAGRQVALLFLDLDRFKNVNDSLGHAVGDELLRQVAQRLSKCARAADTVARLGGDEFVLVLEGVAGPEGAERVAAAVVGAMRQAFLVDQRRLHVSASIGLSLYPDHGETMDELLRNSDTAMYGAKSAGKDAFRRYDPALTTAAQQRLALESDLRLALERDELRLYYQPECSAEDDRILCLEALLRWRRADGRLITPDLFLPVARETGLIVPIGAWVLERACIDCAHWRRAGFDDVRVAVNLAIEQLQHDAVVPLIGEALSRAHLPADALELELIEGSAGHQLDALRERLMELRGLGLTLAIDDFGTGYSSLAHLKQLPFGTLKIDRSFVADIPDDANDMAIAHAVAALAHSLQMAVVAEGVETPAQLRYLRKIDCDLVQGYLYSPPVPAEDVLPMLRAEQGHIRLRTAVPVSG